MPTKTATPPVPGCLLPGFCARRPLAGLEPGAIRSCCHECDKARRSAVCVGCGVASHMVLGPAAGQVDLSQADAFYTAEAHALLDTLAPAPRPYAVACHIGGPVQPAVPVATILVRREAAPGREPARLAEVRRVAGAGGDGLYVGRLGDGLALADLEAEDPPGPDDPAGGPAGDSEPPAGGDGVGPVNIYCGHAVWNRCAGGGGGERLWFRG